MRRKSYGVKGFDIVGAIDINKIACEIYKQNFNIVFENKLYFTKNMVASFFEVDIRTIERYVANNEF